MRPDRRTDGQRDGETDRRTDRRTDMVIPVYPPNFVAGGIITHIHVPTCTCASKIDLS